MKIAIVGLAIPHPIGKELKKKGYTVTMNCTAYRQNILKSWCEEICIR